MFLRTKIEGFYLYISSHRAHNYMDVGISFPFKGEEILAHCKILRYITGG
jgi:hypothetical protein